MFVTSKRQGFWYRGIRQPPRYGIATLVVVSARQTKNREMWTDSSPWYESLSPPPPPPHTRATTVPPKHASPQIISIHFSKSEKDKASTLRPHTYTPWRTKPRPIHPDRRIRHLCFKCLIRYVGNSLSKRTNLRQPERNAEHVTLRCILYR
jgi:hypothetical protein